MPFVVFECADPDRLSVVSEGGPVRELCRAGTLAKLASVVGAAEHRRAQRSAGEEPPVSPTILALRRGCMDALRGAGVELAEFDEAT